MDSIYIYLFIDKHIHRLFQSSLFSAFSPNKSIESPFCALGDRGDNSDVKADRAAMGFPVSEVNLAVEKPSVRDADGSTHRRSCDQPYQSMYTPLG